MADNVQLPVTGTGTADVVAATDDVASVHYPYVKLADGTLGGTDKIGGDAANGLDVDVTRSALPTGAATSAKQDTEIASLATLAGAVAGTEMQVDVLSLPATSATAAKQDTQITSLGTLAAAVAGTEMQVDVVAALPAGDNNIGNVDIVSGTITTVSTVTAVTAITNPVAVTQSGTWDEVGINDSGNSITVDAPVGTPAFVRLSDGAAPIATLPVSLATLPALTAGTAEIGKLAAGTANIGDVDVLTLPALVAGSANIGDVDVLTVPADPFGVNADAASATGSISAKLRSIAAVQLPAALAANGGLKVEGVAGGVAQPVSLATLPALVASSANIGDVDVLTLPNVTLAAGTNTNEVVGDVAHSAGVAGNPLLIAGVSQDTDDTAPPNRVDAESDTTRLATDRDGSLFVRPHGPQVWSYHENSSSQLTDTSVHAAPASGLSLYVTDIVFSTGAATACNIFFEEGASTVLGPYYLEAVAGRGIAIHFGTPKKITAATALTVTTSAAIAHAIDVTGFTAQG